MKHSIKIYYELCKIYDGESFFDAMSVCESFHDVHNGNTMYVLLNLYSYQYTFSIKDFEAIVKIVRNYINVKDSYGEILEYIERNNIKEWS